MLDAEIPSHSSMVHTTTQHQDYTFAVYEILISITKQEE
jgi:hypothetical protein